MNVMILTGWLTAEPIIRVAPGSHEQRLCFDLHGTDSKGTEVKVACFIESPPLIKRMEPVLAPGRSLVLQGEYTTREVREHGRLRMLMREMRVFNCEVPNRPAAQAPEVTQALKEGVME